MGLIYRAPRKGKHPTNFSLSSKGANLSYTFDLGFMKLNIPVLGRRKKVLTTLKGSGLFRKYW